MAYFIENVEKNEIYFIFNDKYKTITQYALF